VLKLQNLSKREGLTEKALDRENLETLEIDRESILLRKIFDFAVKKKGSRELR